MSQQQAEWDDLCKEFGRARENLVHTLENLNSRLRSGDRAPHLREFDDFEEAERVLDTVKQRMKAFIQNIGQ